MPKIIENLSQRLKDEAMNQILTNGYNSMTIRSVASAVGVGVGTVYNYYKSKDELTAAILLDDWMLLLSAVRSRENEGSEVVLRTAYEELRRFEQKFSGVFHDEAAAEAFPKFSGKYHQLLLNQLASLFRSFTEDDYTAEFIAEAILNQSMKGIEFSQIYRLLRKLL